MSWTVPSDNGGSAVTGYQVTPIRAGVRGTTVNMSASTLTKAFTGLDAEVSYAFEVLATNINGPAHRGSPMPWFPMCCRVPPPEWPALPPTTRSP